MVFLSASADLDARRTGPRAYLAADFLGAALASAAETNRRRPEAGAREVVVGDAALLVDRGPASVASAAELTAALARHWDELDALVYVHTVVRPVTLTEVVALDLGGLLATWLGRPATRSPTTSPRRQPRCARPTPPNGGSRRRPSGRAAATNPRIQHREELTDTGRLGDLYDARDRASATPSPPGTTWAALTLLYGVDSTPLTRNRDRHGPDQAARHHRQHPRRRQQPARRLLLLLQHRELDLPDEETRALVARLRREQAGGSYGETTTKVVAMVQERHGLASSGTVDKETAAVLNERLQEAGAFEGEVVEHAPTASARVLSGTVLRAEGVPAADLTLRL